MPPTRRIGTVSWQCTEFAKKAVHGFKHGFPRSSPSQGGASAFLISQPGASANALAMRSWRTPAAVYELVGSANGECGGCIGRPTASRRT